MARQQTQSAPTSEHHIRVIRPANFFILFYYCNTYFVGCLPSKLFSQLKMAKGDGSYTREINRIEKQQLLILDDFGIQPLDAPNRSALMEIIEDRHGKSSIVITSQVPVSMWHEVIGETTIADAVMDRIIHGAHRIDLKGESMRKKTEANNKSQILN